MPLPPPTERTGFVGRYAPSPTGDLHLGNLRTALVAWEEARRAGGTFILRVEDLDTPRCVPGAEERMLDDLRWLGIDWDEGPDVGGPAGPYRQSERSEIYEAALQELEWRGLTFLCTCSRRDLREASAPHPPLGGPLEAEGPPYPGTCRMSDPVTQRLHSNGAAVRFRVSEGEFRFSDAEMGELVCDLQKLIGDIIIRRRDGLWAYQLACAIDDALMGVTHVTRGRDLLSSTPRQLALQRALGLREPQHRHIPLVADATGARMSKRDGSDSLRSLRETGVTPEEARRVISNVTLLD